jgi:SAM-dependent methyltransferase
VTPAFATAGQASRATITKGIVQHANCILCNKPGSPWLEKVDKFPPHETFRIVRCPECRLAWVSPRPAPDEIGRYYPSTYSWTPEGEGGGSLPQRLEWWYRFHLLRFETRQLLRGTDLAPGDPVIDVGCASGERLLVMKESRLSPAGNDITPTADFARQRTGLDVRRGTLEDAHFESGRFRAATLYNVLEHVHDPRRLLGEVRRILLPRGWLVVQSPSAASPQARLFGRRWAALDAPRDLYYYTWRLMARLLESEGFEVARVVFRTSFLHPPTAAISVAPGLDPQRFWLAENRRQRLGVVVRGAAWAALTLAVAPAVWLESALGLGAIPTVFARKGDSARKGDDR